MARSSLTRRIARLERRALAIGNLSEAELDKLIEQTLRQLPSEDSAALAELLLQNDYQGAIRYLQQDHGAAPPSAGGEGH